MVPKSTLFIYCFNKFPCLSFKGVTIIKPVIFGNVSHYFGKKRETDGHTHGWIVFLRPFKNEVSHLGYVLCHQIECIRTILKNKRTSYIETIVERILVAHSNNFWSEVLGPFKVDIDTCNLYLFLCFNSQRSLIIHLHIHHCECVKKIK